MGLFSVLAGGMVSVKWCFTTWIVCDIIWLIEAFIAALDFYVSICKATRLSGKYASKEDYVPPLYASNKLSEPANISGTKMSRILEAGTERLRLF